MFESDLKNKKSQTDVDQHVIDFLGDLRIENKEDLVVLKNLILEKLEFRQYNNDTKAHAGNIQWKRTASEIIQEGFVYQSKACSDLALVFLTLCKASGIDGYLVKLRTLDGADTHSIVEVKLSDNWYRLDPSSLDSKPFVGQLADDQIWNKNWKCGWKVWKRGRDLRELGLNRIH